MDAFQLWTVGFGAALLIGAYTYTFIIDARHTRRMEDAEENWAKRADDMRTARDNQIAARDAQIAELRADTTESISHLTVSLYDFKLHAATTFATIKSVEQVEANLIIAIDKVETRLGSKLDRLTDMVKNGKHA